MYLYWLSNPNHFFYISTNSDQRNIYKYRFFLQYREYYSCFYSHACSSPSDSAAKRSSQIHPALSSLHWLPKSNPLVSEFMLKSWLYMALCQSTSMNTKLLKTLLRSAELGLPAVPESRVRSKSDEAFCCTGSPVLEQSSS